MGDISVKVVMIIFLTVLIGGYAAVFWYISKTMNKFDERQELVKGRGYRYAFGSMMVYFVADLMIIHGFQVDIFAKGADLLIGIFIGIMIYTVYCIMNEAFLSLNQKPKEYFKGMIFLTCITLFFSVSWLFDGGLIENGRLVFSCDLVMILNFIFSATVLAAMVIKKRELEKEAE